MEKNSNQANTGIKRGLRISWGILKWTFISVIGLILIVVIAFMLPPVQRYAIQQGTSWFNENTGGELSIGSIDLRLPFFINLEDVNLKDPAGQHIADIGSLKISLGWRMIFDQTIRVDRLEIEKIDADIYADQQGVWNYNFIIEAFADTSVVPDTAATESAWDFSLGNFKLREAELRYYDGASRDSIQSTIGALDLSMNRFSVTHMVYLVESVSFENSSSYVQMSSSAAESAEITADESSSELPLIGLNALDFKNIKVMYHTLDDSLSMSLNLGSLEANAYAIDLDENKFELSNLDLSDTDFEMRSLSSANPDTSDFDYDIFLPMQIKVDELLVSAVNVNINSVSPDGSESPLILEDIGLEIENLVIDPDKYKLDLESLNGQYAGVPEIKKLNFDLELSRSKFSLSDFNLEMGMSTLNTDILVNYESLQDLIEKGKYSQVSIDISPLWLHPDDAAQLANMAEIPDSSLTLPNQEIELVASLAGDGNHLELSLFDVHMGTSHVSLRGHAEGSDWQNQDIRLGTIDLGIFMADIKSFLPADLDLSTYPQQIAFKGSGQASPQTSELKGDISTDIGDIKVDASTAGWDSEIFPLQAEISSKGLDLAALTGLDTLVINFALTADVKDAVDKERSGNIVLKVPGIDYGKYTVQNLYANVDVDGDNYQYSVELTDSHAVMLISGNARLGDTLEITAKGDINGIDFEYLGITDKDFRLQTHFEASYSQKDSTQTGDFQILETVVIREGDRIDIGPVTGSFLLCPDSILAEVNSDLFTLDAGSNLSVEELSEHFSGMFKKNQDVAIKEDGYARLEFNSTENEILKEFLPDLQSFAPSYATLNYNASTRYIDAHAAFPEIRYNVMGVDSLMLDMEGSAGNVTGKLNIQRAAYDSLAMEGISLSFTPQEAGSLLSFSIKNGMDTAQYLLEANIRYQENAEIPIWLVEPANTFILDGKNWEVDPEALITLKDSIYGIDNFILRRNQNMLSIHTPMDDQVLHIAAENFSLTYLSGLFTLEQDLLEGRFSGQMDMNPDGTFAGNGDISNLNVAGAEFGALTWKAEAQNGHYQLNADLNGPVVDLDAGGTLTSQPDGVAELDMDLNLTRFDFGSLENLLPSLVEKARGDATGSLKLSGTTSAPLLTGNMNFNNITLNLVDNNATYTLKNERINFESGAIVFPSFAITDADGKNMTIDGRIKHQNFQDFVYDLTIRSDNFTLVDLLPGEDPTVYGKLIVDSDISVKGSYLQPEIRSDLALEEGSAIVFQVPEDEYDDASFDGLVEWVSFDEPEPGSGIISRDKEDEDEPVQRASINLDGSLNIDPQTEIKIIIDPLAGDNLTIKGGGRLGLGYDRSGRINLTGTYRVTSGEYLMTFYNIVKRSFKLAGGSTLTWNGDPMTPDMDITAVYETRIALANLMGSQAGGTNESLRRQADFELHMSLTGNLEKPEINFEIKLAPGSRGILGGAADARIAQINQNESELNRQVFAMLVLNTFISDGGGGGGVENQARNSASQILTQQLNSLSDKHISGVQLNFDMQSYTGQTGAAETDLNVDISKSLFNDRVEVKVGSTMELEGENSTADQGQQLITNVVVEYKITEDGRYRFKVFRKVDLEDIVVGRITRTGTGVLFRREFDRGNELFKSDEQKEKEEQEKIKAYRENAAKEKAAEEKEDPDKANEDE